MQQHDIEFRLQSQRDLRGSDKFSQDCMQYCTGGGGGGGVLMYTFLGMHIGVQGLHIVGHLGIQYCISSQEVVQGGQQDGK